MNKKFDNYYLTQLALLIAIELVMKAIGLGSVPVGPLYMSFLTVPIAVGAIMLGPAAGAVLGGVFGAVSFYDALAGRSVMTGALFQVSPINTFILCVVTRVLMGLLVGFVYRAVSRADHKGFVSTLIGSLENGTPVKVTGAVQRDGNDYGWYQIAFNNGSGFVSADYLTTTAPSAAAPGASAQPSGNTGAASGSSGNTSSNTSAAEAGGSEESTTYLVYSQGSGRPVNITGSNGVYYDGEGNVYYAAGGGNFADNSGAYYTTTMPASAPDSEVLGLVSTGSGRPVAITATEDGEFQDDEGNVYYPNEDGTFSDEYDAVYEVSGSNE